MSKRLIAIITAASFAVLAPAAFAATAPECAATASVDTRLAAALARPDRPADQKAKDENRSSETHFVLSQIKPGDHVLDLGAGGGYASMILSAAVCSGSVDAQNPPEWSGSDKAKANWETLSKARPNLHAVISDFVKVPAPAKPYDAIFIGTIYHDTYNMAGHDAVAMDKNLLSLLKPGGIVVLTDHIAPAGSGAADTNTLHRIDKATVLADFKAAGFELVTDSPVLANDKDDHTLKVFDPTLRGHTDRMALVFRRPK